MFTHDYIYMSDDKAFDDLNSVLPAIVCGRLSDRELRECIGDAADRELARRAKLENE